MTKFESVEWSLPNKMLTLKGIIGLVLCLKPTVAHDILLRKNVKDSCLTKFFNELIKDDKSFSIVWQHSLDCAIKDDISKLFSDKVKFILTDPKVETVSGSHNQAPGTTLILASTIMDIVDGISCLNNTNTWSIWSKFIVLHLDNSANGRLQSSDQLFKRVFQIFASWNALNVHIIYKYNDHGMDEFSWFPYEDGNCGTVDRVRLISECKFGFHRMVDTNNEEKFERRCTIAVAVQSCEPYSIYSSDAGFSKGIEIDLVREWGSWSQCDIEFKAIEGSEFHPKYCSFSFSFVNARIICLYSIYFQKFRVDSWFL